MYAFNHREHLAWSALPLAYRIWIVAAADMLEVATPPCWSLDPIHLFALPRLWSYFSSLEQPPERALRSLAQAEHRRTPPLVELPPVPEVDAKGDDWGRWRHSVEATHRTFRTAVYRWHRNELAGCADPATIVNYCRQFFASAIQDGWRRDNLFRMVVKTLLDADGLAKIGATFPGRFEAFLAHLERSEPQRYRACTPLTFTRELSNNELSIWSTRIYDGLEGAFADLDGAIARTLATADGTQASQPATPTGRRVRIGTEPYFISNHLAVSGAGDIHRALLRSVPGRRRLGLFIPDRSFSARVEPAPLQPFSWNIPEWSYTNTAGSRLRIDQTNLDQEWRLLMDDYTHTLLDDPEAAISELYKALDVTIGKAKGVHAFLAGGYGPGIRFAGFRSVGTYVQRISSEATNKGATNDPFRDGIAAIGNAQLKIRPSDIATIIARRLTKEGQITDPYTLGQMQEMAFYNQSDSMPPRTGDLLRLARSVRNVEHHVRSDDMAVGEILVHLGKVALFGFLGAAPRKRGVRTRQEPPQV